MLVCKRCRHEASLTAGTLLEGTCKPLRLWFLALFAMTSSKAGVSAKELQRQLGVSYPSAWAWLQKLRRCMAGGRPLLFGDVEIDEAYVGGVQTNCMGRGAMKKRVALCAVEKRRRGCGRVRLGVAQRAAKKDLEAFAEGAVSPGSAIHTDGWGGCAGLERLGYRHALTSLLRSPQPAHERFPGTHRVFSLGVAVAARNPPGSAQRQVPPRLWFDWLTTSLDEFAFRFNRRAEMRFTHIFQALAQRALRVPPQPVWWIVGRLEPSRPLAA